jgi:hypothetical protein
MSQSELNPTPELPDYFGLPKHVGSVSADMLLDIARSHADRADSIDNDASVRFNEVAASALVEAALTLDRPGDQVDYRLAMIDEAEDRFEQAADAEYHLLERGFRDPDDQADWRRLELQKEFMQVYRDLACGEITLETRQELLTMLAVHHKYANSMSKYSATSSRHGRGLREEIAVMIHLWERWHPGDSTVAFPSTARGGSGVMRGDETHDIVVASLDDDSLRFDHIEVKAVRTRLRFDYLTRYASRLVSVDSHGKLRWLDEISAA